MQKKVGEDNDYTSHNIDYIICFDQLQRKDTRKKKVMKTIGKYINS